MEGSQQGKHYQDSRTLGNLTHDCQQVLRCHEVSKDVFLVICSRLPLLQTWQLIRTFSPNKPTIVHSSFKPNRDRLW
jgi:hypothetical protein